MENAKKFTVPAKIYLLSGREVAVQHQTNSTKTTTILSELLGYIGGKRVSCLTYQVKPGVYIGINTAQILFAVVTSPNVSII